MRSCDDCPGNTDCAGVNLHPVLVQVLDLYAGGTTDKFDILFKLGEGSEALIEKYDHRVSDICWSKAALLAIAEAMSRAEAGGNAADVAKDSLKTACAAFKRFPWKLGELVDQAPDLYQAILDQSAEDLGAVLSKRAFVKICRDVAYGR